MNTLKTFLQNLVKVVLYSIRLFALLCQKTFLTEGPCYKLYRCIQFIWENILQLELNFFAEGELISLCNSLNLVVQ